MIQNQEQRHVHYDRDLELEAYQLSGIVQKFPNHFHECYVIGFVEGGKRHLWCKNQECDVSAGDLILFNPRDNHCCAPVDGQLLEEPYLEEKALGTCNIELPYQVPDGRWFVMGDHRSVSVDSRDRSVGCVSEEQVVGRLTFRIWPLDSISSLE